MQLTVSAFGKLKTPGLRESADYYSKLIQTFSPLVELELKPIAVPDKSPATRARIQTAEAVLLNERLESRLKTRQFGLILLDESGKSKSTQDWARKFEDWRMNGPSEIVFCVGSSLGFSAELKKRAHALVSLGPQTLSHELARVVLLEQIYRALSVVHGHPYHVSG